MGSSEESRARPGCADGVKEWEDWLAGMVSMLWQQLRDKGCGNEKRESWARDSESTVDIKSQQTCERRQHARTMETSDTCDPPMRAGRTNNHVMKLV